MDNLLGPEQVEKARKKIELQRDRVARSSIDTPDRARQERVLDAMLKNAQLAELANFLLT